jgi:hypothetical protein
MTFRFTAPDEEFDEIVEATVIVEKRMVLIIFYSFSFQRRT